MRDNCVELFRVLESKVGSIAEVAGGALDFWHAATLSKPFGTH